MVPDDTLQGLRGKRILLIGGAGFIGHNLALRLAALGAEPIVIDGLQVNNLLAIQHEAATNPYADLYLAILNQRLSRLRERGIPVLVEDARDYLRLGRSMSDIRPDAVVLLAAVSHASRSNKDPYHTFDHSFRTLENALDIARGREGTHFIYFSSSMVYGNFKGATAQETDSCAPIGIYGALKFGGEALVRAYDQVFSLPTTIIRPSALYGPGCISRRVIQVFIENALSGRPMVIRGSGDEALDFTHIDDLVSGVVQALDNPKAYRETFNVTRGRARTVGEVAEIIQKHIPTAEVTYGSATELNPERGTLDVSKARSLLGYRPRVDLESGIAEYIEWYSSFAPLLAQAGSENLGPRVNE